VETRRKAAGDYSQKRSATLDNLSHALLLVDKAKIGRGNEILYANYITPGQPIIGVHKNDEWLSD
jgi:hypothetical protein